MLPIALTIMVSKLVGDAFTEGIYDLHLKLKQYPTLPDEPPRAREGLLARHIMATDVKTVCELEQVCAATPLRTRAPPAEAAPLC